MSSLFSKDDEKVPSKDQKPTTDLGSADSKPETIGSKIVLYQPAIEEQKGEASVKVAEGEKSKDLTPTTDKNEPGTSKAKDEISPETEANQPETSEQSSSGKKEPATRRRRSILGLPISLKRTSSRLRNSSIANANVIEQVDSGRRNTKKRRIALFLDADYPSKK